MNNACDGRHFAWPLFLRTYSVLMDRLEDELRSEGGLPLAWFDVLAQLQDAPDGRMRMQDLADSVLLSKSGLTRLVDRMANEGLLDRVSCPADRRVVYAATTTKGRKAFQKAAPIAARGVQEHFAAKLTSTEEKALASAFKKILRAEEATRPRAQGQAAS